MGTRRRGLRNRVFISYRRTVRSAHAARQLFGGLEDRFYRGVAYFDREAPNLERFDREIRRAVERSDVVIALIEPDWYRPFEPEVIDWALEELLVARRNDIQIKVVCVESDGADPTEADGASDDDDQPEDDGAAGNEVDETGDGERSGDGTADKQPGYEDSSGDGASDEQPGCEDPCDDDDASDGGAGGEVRALPYFPPRWIHAYPAEIAELLDGLERETGIQISAEYERAAYTKVLDQIEPLLPRRARRRLRRWVGSVSVAAALLIGGVVVYADYGDHWCEAPVVGSLDPCERSDLRAAAGQVLILPLQPNEGTSTSTADVRTEQVSTVIGSGALTASRGYPRSTIDPSTGDVALVLDDTRDGGLAAQAVVAGSVERAGPLDRLSTEVYLGELFLASEVTGLRVELDPISVSTAEMNEESPAPEMTAGLAPLTEFLESLTAYQRADPQAVAGFERLVRSRPPPALEALARHLMANLLARRGDLARAAEEYAIAEGVARDAGADDIAERARFGSIEALLLPGIRAAVDERPICSQETIELLQRSTARFGALVQSTEPFVTEMRFKAQTGLSRALLSLASCDRSTYTDAYDAADAALGMLAVEIDPVQLRDQVSTSVDDVAQNARGAISFALATRARARLQLAIAGDTVEDGLEAVLTDLQAAAAPALTFDPALQLSLLLEVLDVEERFGTGESWSRDHRTLSRSQRSFDVWRTIDAALDCDDDLDRLLRKFLDTSCDAVAPTVTTPGGEPEEST